MGSWGKLKNSRLAKVSDDSRQSSPNGILKCKEERRARARVKRERDRIRRWKKITRRKLWDMYLLALQEIDWRDSMRMCGLDQAAVSVLDDRFYRAWAMAWSLGAADAGLDVSQRTTKKQFRGLSWVRCWPRD